ncbi:MAG TPA: hypothetical protein VNQ55_06565 [Parapedobacter sp.]|nr:hypothetical protein [Parapedobacter sp.]
MKTPIICILIGLFITAMVQGKEVKPRIAIGDTMPDITLGTVLNHSVATTSLYTFRKPLLLIEFWDIYCSSCIAGMAKLQKLQTDFEGQVQILLVTKNSADDVRALRGRNERVRNCTLPMVVGDTALTALFRYQTVPAFAWIDQDARLTHFTAETKFVNDAGFRRYLEGDQLHMEVKKEYGDFERNVSLLTEGGGRNIPRIEYYSLISRKVDFDQSYDEVIRDSLDNITGARFINQSMIELFLAAYKKSLTPTGFPITENRIFIEDPTPSKFYPRQIENYYGWKQENTYCYEAVAPPGNPGLFNRMMKKDLSNYFGFSASFEERDVSCLVLQIVDSTRFKNRINTIKGKQSFRFSADSIVVRNFNFSTVLAGIYNAFIEGYEELPILVNETNIDKNLMFDIRLVGDFRKLDVLRRQLKTYGLDLIPQERKLDVMVLYK